MNIYIKNSDDKKSLLIIAVRKQKDGIEKLFKDAVPEDEPKPNRSVLRPGEDGNYNLTEDYFVGMEVL